MADKEKCIKALPFWNKLTEKEKAEVQGSLSTIDYPAGSLLHTTGECLGLIMIAEGRIRAYMMSDEGKEVTLYHLQEGDCDVLSAACVLSQITFDTEMTAEKDTRIVVLPASVLSKLKEKNIYVRSFIYEKLSARFSDVMNTMQRMLFYGVDQRVAAYLLDKSGDQNTIALTHEKIAVEINTAREVVARILRRFSKEGLLETGRGKITIHDKLGLQKIAGDLAEE